MKLFKRLALICPAFGASLLLSAFTADHAQAAITITGQQVGTDFIFSYTGSIDLSGTALFSAGLTFPSSFIANPADGGIYNFIGTGSFSAYLDTFVNQPSSFGTNTLQVDADSATGSTFLIQGAGFPDAFGVPDGYVSGDPISGSATYNNATAASLGLTPGTYVWELSNGDTITQTIVPEPLTLLGASAAVAFGAAFKRRKAQ
ncbi:MAG: hypothetical protein RLZZ490_1552 [Cyanobacteriota bacterium]|jgi:hypothetical protein